VAGKLSLVSSGDFSSLKRPDNRKGMQPMATESALLEQAAALLDMNDVTTPKALVSPSLSHHLVRVDDGSATDEHEPQTIKLRAQKGALRCRKQRQRRKDERDGLEREDHALTQL
jgi:hypothetical protein